MNAPFPPGARVQLRRDLGTVRRVFAQGHAYEIELTHGERIVCIGEVLAEAPANVVMLRRPGVETSAPGPEAA